jgi:hypothetical protein
MGGGLKKCSAIIFGYETSSNIWGGGGNSRSCYVVFEKYFTRLTLHSVPHIPYGQVCTMGSSHATFGKLLRAGLPFGGWSVLDNGGGC